MATASTSPQAPPATGSSSVDMGKLEGTTSIPKPKTANDALHGRAVELLVEIKSKGQKAKDYNTRRREATAALRPVLTEIWQKFKTGETVGGFAGKEAWAKGQAITIRWCQAVIAGPQPQQAKSVRLAVGKIVKIADKEYTLTQEMLDAFTNAAPIPTAAPTTKTKAVHSVASGPTVDEERRHAEPSAPKLTSTKKELIKKSAQTNKVLVARIDDTHEFGVFPELCDEHTAARALKIGTKQVCESERDSINANRAPNADSVEVVLGAANIQVNQTTVSV